MAVAAANHALVKTTLHRFSAKFEPLQTHIMFLGAHFSPRERRG